MARTCTEINRQQNENWRNNETMALKGVYVCKKNYIPTSEVGWI